MAVVGVLKHVPAIEYLAGYGQRIHCYESSKERIPSKLDPSLMAFSRPKLPHLVSMWVDEPEATGVSIAFIFEDVPIKLDLLPGAVVVGTEERLRKVLKGHQFYPMYQVNKIAAVKLV